LRDSRASSSPDDCRFEPYFAMNASTSPASSMPPMSDAELLEIAVRLGERLQQKGLMLATAESCTGGWIAKTVTDVPGCSAWFEAGVAAYSYEAKQALLGVRPETLTEHGAVSRETALEMVAGALIHTGATVAVAVTGIAGPSGGTPDKPVGTVWIAWKRRGGYPSAKLFHFDGGTRQTVTAALEGVLALVP
jgi:nicotinamide-nucleotide amidase